MSDELDLEAIKARQRCASQTECNAGLVDDLLRIDIPALIAEVERLRTPQVGSWVWALEQIKAGFLVKRASTTEAPIMISNGVLMYHPLDPHRQFVVFDTSDFEAPDWQIAEDQP